MVNASPQPHIGTKKATFKDDVLVGSLEEFDANNQDEACWWLIR